MVSKDSNGKNTPVPGLILTTIKEVVRYQNALKQIALKKEKELHESVASFGSIDSIVGSKKYKVKVDFQ